MDLATKNLANRVAFILFIIIGSCVLALLAVMAIFDVSFDREDHVYVITGESMEPNLNDGEKITINESSSYENNQIVVFEPPDDWPTNQPLLIKRIRATPGDKIIYKNNTFFVNNNKIYTTPLNQCNIDDYSYTLKDNELFVVGDNTDHSSDSIRMTCRNIQAFVTTDEVRTHGKAIKVDS